MRKAVACLLNLVSICLIAGCSSSSRPGPREIQQFPVAVNRDLDLLFLIDDSISMADQQANFAARLPGLFDALGKLPGGLPNLHIGVATSDLGTLGAEDSNPSFGPPVGRLGTGGCAGTGKNGELQTFGAPINSGVFLSDVADPTTGVRTRNYTGELSAVVARMTSAGATGCGFEQVLEAVKRALAPTSTVNQGFLRPTAALGVILLTNEDDCSARHYALFTSDTTALGPVQSFRCTAYGVTCDQSGLTSDQMKQIGPKSECHPNDGSELLTTVSDYAVFLRSLKADPMKIVVAAIAGAMEPFATELRPPPQMTMPIPALAHSCMYVSPTNTLETGDPPIRIKALLDEFEGRSALTSICQQDLSGAMQQIGDMLKTAMGAPCFEAPLADVDPGKPDAQYDCTVTVTSASAAQLTLPRCSPESSSAANKPCWHLVIDPAICPSADHLAPVIEGRDILAPDGNVAVSCRLAASL